MHAPQKNYLCRAALLLLVLVFCLAQACGEKVDYQAKAMEAVKKRDWPAAVDLAGKAIDSGAYQGRQLAQAHWARARARLGILNQAREKGPQDYQKALLPVGLDAAAAMAADPSQKEAGALYYGLLAVVTSVETMRWFKSQPREAVNKNQFADYREGLARKRLRELQKALGPGPAAKAKAFFQLAEEAHQQMRDKILGRRP